MTKRIRPDEVVNGWTVSAAKFGKTTVWNVYRLDTDGFWVAFAPRKPGCYWAFDTKREAIAWAKVN